jgi:hypothetical protein
MLLLPFLNLCLMLVRVHLSNQINMFIAENFMSSLDDKYVRHAI